MWRALERIIPDIRSRCEVSLVGTPLTHERFLRRHRGSYGPAIAANTIAPLAKHLEVIRVCCREPTIQRFLLIANC